MDLDKGITRTRFMSPEELSMQSLVKQLYKNHIFRGFYLERCFVQKIGDYRDLIALDRAERDLEKMLLKSFDQLQIFYQQNVPNMFIGINCITGKQHQNQLETCLLTEFNDLAFGEYWFCIRTLRFRDNEVQFKIKMVRPVESQESPLIRQSLSDIRINRFRKPDESKEKIQEESPKLESQPEISFSDFLALLKSWGDSTKQTIYDFMAHDVNKRNILGVIRFLGLIIVSLVGGLFIGLRFMGIFTIRFLYELSRFTHAATPIILKLIDFVNKLVGGIFILFTMIWKDLVVNRGGTVVQKHPLEENTSFLRLTREQRFNRDRRSTHYKSIGNFQ